MEQDILGTDIRPADFTTAARRYGRHFARYLLARNYAAGKRVIDAACGAGMGAALLAEVAQSVLGLDLDEKLLDWAQAHFARPNVTYRLHNLHNPVEAAEPVDLITSFETLEHVREPGRCLGNLAACLRGDGVALVSVPNGTKELCEQADKPYHKRHFSAEELTELVKTHFERVELFSQVYRRGPSHYIRKLATRARHHARNYRFMPGLDPQAKTWLAVARGPRHSADA